MYEPLCHSGGSGIVSLSLLEADGLDTSGTSSPGDGNRYQDLGGLIQL